MVRRGTETHRGALDRPRRRVVDLRGPGMLVQEFKLARMAMAAWSAMLLALTLTAPVAVSAADFERAKAAFEREEYSVALSEFHSLAEQGHSDAQTYLERMYGNGQGVPQDYVLAAQWIRKAAEQGYANAQFNLGLRYYYGEGVPQDYVFSYAWSNLAAAQAHREARELRDKLRLAMTSGQIAEAQALSREFRGRTERANTTTPPNRLEAGRVDRRPTGSGSGFLVGPGGKILTNNHVVDGCAQVTVRHSGERHCATVHASDATNDLALLAAPGLSGETAAFSESPQPALGETATVAGYPFGGLLASDLHVTGGNISALAGLGDDSTRLQITAPVQPGNSGGPLLDESGNVIGVVVSRLNAPGVARATGSIPQNVNFAMKGAVARMFLEIHGVPYGRAGGDKKLSTQAVADLARGFTVAVECWEWSLRYGGRDATFPAPGRRDMSGAGIPRQSAEEGKADVSPPLASNREPRADPVVRETGATNLVPGLNSDPPDRMIH